MLFFFFFLLCLFWLARLTMRPYSEETIDPSFNSRSQKDFFWHTREREKRLAVITSLARGSLSLSFHTYIMYKSAILQQHNGTMNIIYSSNRIIRNLFASSVFSLSSSSSSPFFSISLELAYSISFQQRNNRERLSFIYNSISERFEFFLIFPPVEQFDLNQPKRQQRTCAVVLLSISSLFPISGCSWHLTSRIWPKHAAHGTVLSYCTSIAIVD